MPCNTKYEALNYTAGKNLEVIRSKAFIFKTKKLITMNLCDVHKVTLQLARKTDVFHNIFGVIFKCENIGYMLEGKKHTAHIPNNYTVSEKYILIPARCI